MDENEPNEWSSRQNKVVLFIIVIVIILCVISAVPLTAHHVVGIVLVVCIVLVDWIVGIDWIGCIIFPSSPTT